MAKSSKRKRKRHSISKATRRPVAPGAETASVDRAREDRPPSRPKRRLGTALALGGIGFLAVLLRSLFPYRSVLGEEGIRLPMSDAWYHFRLVENLVANFPERLLVDPFALHPGGQRVEIAPMLDYLVAGLALVLGRGAPSPRLVEQVAAWTPALLGGATVIAVFLLTRRILGTRTGLLAALFAAIQPGQFLNRSLLGSLDHHVLEALFSTLLLWLLVEAVERPIVGDRGRWLRVTACWGVAAGVSLAAYLLSWSGGVLWCGLIALWLGITAAWELFRERPLERLAAAGFLTGLVGWFLLLPLGTVLPRAPLLRSGALAIAGLAALTWALERLGRKFSAPGWLRATALIASFGLIVLVARFAAPEILAAARAQLSQLRGSEASRTVIEARPLLLFGQREPSLRPLWLIFGSSALIATPGLLRLLATMRRGATPGRWLLLVWTIVTLWITLQQNRFGYYFSLPLAVLAAYTCDGILGLADRDVLTEKAGSANRPARRSGERGDRLYRTLGIAIVILLVVYPNLGPAVAAGRVERSLTPAWSEALGWLRSGTPEPFGDDGYLASAGRSAELATSGRGWGVLAWWDYGYWISTAARRPPTSNPTQSGAGEAARFLLGTDVSDALNQLDLLGARFVLVDEELPFRVPRPGSPPQGKFDSLATWAELPATRFRRVFRLRRPDGSTATLPTYLPDYYRTMLARLYLFGGRRVEPSASTYVLDIENGEAVKVTRFDSEEEARLYLDLEPEADRRVVGLEPDKSPVRLEAVRGLALRFESEAESPGLEDVPQLRIFERLSGDAP